MPSSRGSGQTKQPDAPLPTFHGTLAHLDDKSITLNTDDHREIDFKRTGKTRFFKGDREAKPADFKPGDEVSVDAPQDSAGNLTAVNVRLESAASAGSSAGAETAANGEKTPGTWSSAAAAPSPDTAAKPVTEAKPAPAKPDADDPGPPVLRRGKPNDPEHTEAKPIPETAQAAAPPDPDRPVLIRHSDSDSAAGAAPPAPAPADADRPVLIRHSDSDSTARAAPSPPAPRALSRGDEDLPFPSLSADPVIRKATDAALDFTEALPDYVCQEMIARFQSETRPANWQPLDVVSTEVVYRDGKEEYRNVAVNGKPTKKPIEESGGAWSTGEFGTVLISLFSPGTAARFRYVRDSRTSGLTAREYSFQVARENSNWTVQAASQSYRPAYSGTVWIDPATFRVLRIEMQAEGLPGEFPLDHVESATDYGYVRLGDTRQFLLPVHSETLSCQRSSVFCARNQIDFRNYHKFEGESTVTFGAPKQ